MSRIDPIMKNLIGNEKPDDLATEILDAVSYTHLTLPTKA